MMKTKLKNVLLLGLLLIFALAACGGGEENTSEDENTAVTQVVETAMAAISQTAAVQSPTPNHTPTFTPAPTSTETPTATNGPTATLPAVPTNTSVFQQPGSEISTCDSGGFVKDVTIPDGTNMAIGTKFTKTWEIKNIGTCTWNKNYQIVFYGGEQMAADTILTFTDKDIEPGESVQISIEMTAPDKTGNFDSYWILRNDVGQNFFVDGSSIYVKITVGLTQTPTYTPVPNDPPEITISEPANGKDFPKDTEIAFRGVATDPEDGDISNLIEWKSDIDGFLGTGANILFTLSGSDTQDVTHTITATIEDSDGEEEEVSITVVVKKP